MQGVDTVINDFPQEDKHEPIFVVDILKSIQHNQQNEFIYSSQPSYYATVIMQVFDKAVTDIQKFPNLESKVINELIHSSERSEKFLKVPHIPLSDPTLEETSQLSQKILN